VLSTVSDTLFAFNSASDHPLDAVYWRNSDNPFSIIASLISETQVRHVRPDLFPPAISRLHERRCPHVNPEPTNLVPVPAQAAERLGTSSWRVGRLALGTLLVLVAILGGALVLQGAQRLQPVYVAARDLPSGIVLDTADLAVARVKGA
jgi:hypothetical protein